MVCSQGYHSLTGLFQGDNVISKTTAVGIWFPGLIIGGLLAWHVYQAPPPGLQPGSDSVHAYAGLPHSDKAVSVLENSGFTVGYSEQRRNPLWVAYRLQPLPAGKLSPRPKFAADPRSTARVSHGDLSARGYDRGHLAPNYAMTKLFGPQAQRESFLMTNIVAQKSRLNQLLWQRIEEIEVDHILPRWRELWVVTGPVFDDQPQRLRSGIEIPSAFYRIWLDVTALGQARALALLVPQDVRGDEPLTRFLTSVDQIEARTGLDFFAMLPAAEQARLESAPADARAWGFAAVACNPARYGKDWQGKNGVRLRYDRCG